MKPWQTPLPKAPSKGWGEKKEQRERTPSPSQKIKTQSESQKSTATNRVLKPPPSQEAYQKEKEMKKEYT